MKKILGSYRPDAVECSFFGIKIEGFTPDNAVTISKDEPTNTVRKAQDGSCTAFLEGNPTYKVVIHLQQSSGANDWIYLIHEICEKYGTTIKMPLLVKDLSGNTYFFATEVVFENIPETVLGKTVGDANWTFYCYDASFTKGGNVKDSDLVDTLQYLKEALEVAEILGVNLSNFESKIAAFGQESFSILKDKF